MLGRGQPIGECQRIPAHIAMGLRRALALHVAVMHGRKDIVDLLLAHGADINARDDKYRFNALIHAIDLADFMPEYAALGMVEFLAGARRGEGRLGMRLAGRWGGRQRAWLD